MNALLSSSALAWLGDVTLQASIIMGLALISSFGVWRLSAAKRHTLLLLALCSVPLLMVASLQAPRWSWHASPSRPVDTAWQSKVTLTSKDEPVSVAAPKEGSTSATPKPTVHWNPFLIVWLGGVALMLGKLGFSLLRLRSLKHRCAVCEDARATTLMTSHPGVELLISTDAIMPMTWGVLRSVIVLPVSSSEWSAERLRLVVEHELAHVERRDALAHLLCSLSACLLWFHPLTWLVQRRLAQVREAACDDHVLQKSIHAPADYADELLQTITALRSEGRAMPLAPALAIGMASMAARELKARLASILDENTDRSVFSVRRRWLGALSFATLAALLSSLSACREAPKAVLIGHRVADDDSRIYFLSDAQFNRLAGSTSNHSTVSPTDPFAGNATTSAASDRDLVQLAMRLRTKLLDEGIAFQPNERGEALVMTDERAMKVWADETNHTKITTLISRGGPMAKLVRMNMFAFQVPVTSEHLKYLVDESSGTGFVMRGVLTEEQGNSLLIKLREDKEIKLMATPTTTTKSGQRSTIEVVREFLYPTEFDPPDVQKPDKITGKPGPVIPATPTAFEMRPVGLRMQFQASIADGSIDLELVPELTSFEGFINYGSPIKERSENVLGAPVELTLTENRIPQPVFSTNKITTSVAVNDSSYVILGGAANESASKAGPVEKLDLTKNDVDLKKLPNWGSSKTAIFFLIQASIVKNEGK